MSKVTVTKDKDDLGANAPFGIKNNDISKFFFFPGTFPRKRMQLLDAIGRFWSELTKILYNKSKRKAIFKLGISHKNIKKLRKLADMYIKKGLST